MLSSMYALTVLLPAGSVMVPVDDACAVQPDRALVVYVKLDVTRTPFNRISRVADASWEWPHQSTVIDCDALVNVPAPGVMVAWGGGQRGSPSWQMLGVLRRPAARKPACSAEPA